MCNIIFTGATSVSTVVNISSEDEEEVKSKPVELSPLQESTTDSKC